MATKVKCNVENVTRVADAIEGHTLDLGFNMVGYLEPGNEYEDRSGHQCGTVACIAGWAKSVDVGGSIKEPWDCGFFDDAAKFLGLSTYTTPEARSEADELFAPTKLGADYDDVWARIPQAAAVEVLRHLASKGKIDWPRAIKLHPLIEEAA